MFDDLPELGHQRLVAIAQRPEADDRPTVQERRQAGDVHGVDMEQR